MADISSGRNADIPNSNIPRFNSSYSNAHQAYRFDGSPGAGLPSNIRYDERFDPSAPGARFNSLGHESVHAWRNANGVAVSPLALSPRQNDPVIRDNPPLVKDIISHHSHMQEEFETVGMKPTRHTPNRDGWAPNENMIRQEHGLPLRNDYSGVTHPQVDSMLKNIDTKTDDRGWFDKKFGKEPSPVQSIIDHLEK